MANVTNYEPISAVVDAHNIPHLTLGLSQAESNHFDPAETDYLTSLVVFPAIVLAIGVLCLFVWHFICCCCCCKCLKVVDKVEKDEVIDEERAARIKSKRVWNRNTFFVLLFGVVLCDQLFIGYNSNVNAGVDTMGSGFDVISTKVTVIVDSFENISVTTASMNVSLNAASVNGCMIPSSIISSINSLSDITADMTNQLDPIPDGVDSARDVMKEYLKDKKDSIMFPVYFILFLVVGAYIFAYCTHSKCVFKILTLCTALVQLGLVVLVSLNMIFLMFFGDFCMHPARNLLQYVDGTAAYDILNYYLQCTGSNPIANSVDDVDGLADDLTTMMNYLAGNCTGEPNVLAAVNQIPYVFDDVDDVLDVMQCSTIYNAWRLVAETGLCGDFFEGYYGMVISLAFIALFLFACNVTTSIITQYFGHMWEIGNDHKVLPDQDSKAISDPGNDDVVEMIPVAQQDTKLNQVLPADGGNENISV